jgi:hypothetical protein
VRVAFVPREQPLTPAAAAAVGPVARRLAERLLAAADSQLGSLRAVASRDVLLLVGEAESLPWVDGIAYLGYDPGAPRLLLPTALQPDVPADLFERALFRRLADAPGPLAVLSSPRLLVQAASARRLERRLLEQWLSRCT